MEPIGSPRIASDRIGAESARAALAAESLAASRADKQQQRPLRVADEFVTLGSPAVLKCRPAADSEAPSAAALAASAQAAGWLAGRSQAAQPTTGALAADAIEWFTSDGIRIQPGEINKGKPLSSFVAVVGYISPLLCGARNSLPAR